MEITQKSTLAKLLATENVSVEHQKVSTAYFDLKERKVVLPIFNEMSSDLYDLLIGHEVSHALNTPLEGWHDAASVKGKGFKSFLNVVEDARIERDIKSRYPGLVKNFFKGYKELYERDFFGLEGKDINDYPLIDRINIHFKVGMFAAVEFTDAELAYVDKVANCENWEDVVAVATEIYELSKDEQAMIDMADDLMVDSGEGDISEEDEVIEESADKGEEENQDDNGENSDDSDEGQDESDETTEETVPSDETTEDESEFDPVSATDTAFRDNDDQLIDTGAGEYLYANFPKLDYKKWVNMEPWAEFENSEFLEIVRNVEVNNWSYKEEKVDCAVAIEELTKDFRTKNNAYINFMVQQFEAKRKAAQFAKSRENKTGVLNSDKLWATKLTEDVFLSNTIVPDGKNHGMLMVIDFSGSMYDKMSETIEQMLVQVSFCKKVNIPFEVYSFTDRHWGDDQKHLVENQKESDVRIVDSNICINKLISSDMSSAGYKRAFSNLLLIATAYSYRYNGKPYVKRETLPPYLGLGGTPLAETILLLRDRAIDFRNHYNIEVLNTLFLTDGGNTGHLDLGKTPSYRSPGNKDRVVITEGGVTTIGYNQSKLYGRRWSDVICETVLKHFDKTTGSRTINYFLGNPQKRDLGSIWTDMHGYDDPTFENKYKSEWLKDGFMQMDGMNGFASAYVLRAKDLGNVEDLEVVSDKKNDLVRGFRKFQKSKTTSRKFLTKFIEKIA
jgi:cobalamin biosynthesis protein CobT